MQTDTQSRAADGSSDSSSARRKSKPGGSPKNSPPPLVNGQAEDDGDAAGPKLTPADVLLTLLQSHLSELKQAGVRVKLYKMAEGTQIALTGVWVCQEHQILHSGLKCHQCK